MTDKKTPPNVMGWLSGAETALGVAEHLLKTYRPLPAGIVCFHAQQASEKALKAAIVALTNDGDAALYYPAAYDTVIGAGSVDKDGLIASGSNHNESVFVTAPGVAVRTTAASGGYTTGTGTSFSVPQAAAAAAVLRGIDGALTPEDIRTLIAGSAEDRGEEGYDVYYGHGILDLAGCVSALMAEKKESDRCSFLPEEEIPFTMQRKAVEEGQQETEKETARENVEFYVTNIKFENHTR